MLVLETHGLDDLRRSKWPLTFADSVSGFRLLIGRGHDETDRGKY